MKWPWSRKNKNAVTPEYKEYYKAERRERASIAWLLGFATLVVTTLIVLGLFFGGRWLYRTLTNDDNDSVATENSSSENSSGSSSENGADSSTPPTTQNPAAEAPNPQPSPTPNPTPNPSPTLSANTPTTGDTDIPHTGPEGELQ